MQRNQFRHWGQVLAPHRFAFCAALGAMAGAGTYFGVPVEPSVWVGVGLALLALVLVVAARTQMVLGAGIFVLFAAAGFVLGQWQVVRANPVDYAMGRKPHWLVGTVEEVFVKPDNPKRAVLRLRDVELYGLGPERVARASVGVYTNQVKGVTAGQGVAVQAVLMPPEPPKYAGQRDGRIWRFFEDARVTGYVMGLVEATERKQVLGVKDGALAWVEQLRDAINVKTKDMAGGAVTALLTGEEKWVTPEIREAYRNSGLSHLLAISGMQLTLVGLGIFGVTVWLLAWVPNLALWVNIRLVAALVAMAGVVFYTFLAGASISLVRAAVMSLLVLLAVVTGRMSMGLRAWCIAAILIVLVNPMMVMRAGFQLSAAAVLGLLLLVRQPKEGWHWGGKAGWWLRELLLATVVAGAMTAPVLAANFGQFNVVGLVGNLVAVPVMTVATYAGMLTLVLWPVGLEGIALGAMSLVVEGVTNWALWLERFGMASVVIPKELWWVLLPFVAAVVGAVLLERWVWAVLAVVAMTGTGVGLAKMMPVADVLVWDGGKVGLVRDGEVYKPLWTVDGMDEVVYMARGAGVEVVAEDEVSRVVDERFMPVTELEDFAWASKIAGRWHVEPVSCGRPWQNLAEACWK